jgi:hypothetical protein
VRSRKESRSFGYGGFGVVDTTKNLRAIERESEREERMLVRKEFLSCLVKKKKRIGREFLFTNWMQRELHRIVFWSHKAFPQLCQGFSEEGKWLFHRCRKCNRLMADGAKALLLCSSKTVMFVVVIVAALHREVRCPGFFYLLLSVLRRLCFIVVNINFCSRELFFLKRNG